VIAPDVRTLIRTMAEANPLWGAPRIHGELLKLGIDVSHPTTGDAQRCAYVAVHRKRLLETALIGIVSSEMDSRQ
jgi:hypothetical protein